MFILILLVKVTVTIQSDNSPLSAIAPALLYYLHPTGEGLLCFALNSYKLFSIGFLQQWDAFLFQNFRNAALVFFQHFVELRQ